MTMRATYTLRAKSFTRTAYDPVNSRLSEVVVEFCNDAWHQRDAVLAFIPHFTEADFFTTNRCGPIGKRFRVTVEEIADE